MFVLIPKHFLCFRYLLSSFFLWSFAKKYCLHASFSMSVCYRFEWWVGHWQKKGKGTSGNVASGVQNRHYKTKIVQKTVWIGISRNGPYPSWSHDMRNLSSPLRFIPLERCCLLCGLLFDGLVLWSGFVFAKSVGWQCFQKLKMQNRTTKGSNNLPWFSCLTMFVLLCFSQKHRRCLGSRLGDYGRSERECPDPVDGRWTGCGRAGAAEIAWEEARDGGARANVRIRWTGGGRAWEEARDGA